MVREVEISMGKKSKKIPGAPKPPLNSYMEFVKAERVRILSGGTMPTIELSRVIGQKWRTLSAEEKAIYVERSKENRVRYEAEKAAFMFAFDTEPQPFTSSGTISRSRYLVLIFFIAAIEEEIPQTTKASEEGASINLDDIGFAKHARFEWHPALKTSLLARGTRVRVKFFGTGELGTVDESQWVTYSEEEEARLSKLLDVSSFSFTNGMNELKKLRHRILR